MSLRSFVHSSHFSQMLPSVVRPWQAPAGVAEYASLSRVLIPFASSENNNNLVNSQYRGSRASLELHRTRLVHPVCHGSLCRLRTWTSAGGVVDLGDYKKCDGVIMGMFLTSFGRNED